MRFGIFDHLDLGGAPLERHYEDRLRLVELYDRAGFHAYHLAEHHATPLGAAPSPSVFLAAVAQRTRRLRFGPLVYTLPLYHPLRLIEEICMLDRLSGGRLELGVGRGISPYEVAYFGVDPAETQARYVEMLDLIRKGLASETLDFAGKFYRVAGVPMVLSPAQRPHPPLWYGIVNPAGADWCAANRVNVVSHVAPGPMRAIVERYTAAFRAAHGAAAPLPLIGLGRHMVIAEDGAEARAVARRAYARWYDSFTVLWRRFSAKPVSASYPPGFDALAESGVGLAGTPAEIAAAIGAQIAETSANYWICRFAFGDLSYAESARSVALFVERVMPALARHAA